MKQPVRRQEGSPPSGELARQKKPLSQQMAEDIGAMMEDPKTPEDEEFLRTRPTPESRRPSRSRKALEAYVQAANPRAEFEERPLPEGKMGFVRTVDPDTLVISTRQRPVQREETILHEMEHSLSERGGNPLGVVGKFSGEPVTMDNNYRFDLLYNMQDKKNKVPENPRVGDLLALKDSGNGWKKRLNMVQNFIENKDQIEKFFGRPIESAYFKPEMFMQLAANDNSGALFAEQIADLSALEQITGKSLTRDPQMRKLLFPDSKAAAVFDAITGYRQTRLDSKDLPPYTPVFPEEPGILDWIKGKLGIQKREEGSPKEGEVSEGELARRTLDFLRKQESSKFEGLSKQPRLDLPKVAKDVVRAAPGVAKDVVRGVQYTPFDVLGAPVDIATMAMRPFGYNVEKPVGGSDYLIEQAAKIGLAQPQTGSVAEFAGRVLGGGLAPVVASKTGKIGEATEEFIKAELAKPPEGAVKNPFGFFSPLEDVVSDLPQAKGTANQYLAQISKAKGIKSDELNATGLKEFLASRGNAPLTKQEIQDFIAQNTVKVDEVMLGKGQTLSPEAKRLSDEAFSRMEEIDDKIAPFFERALANNEGIGGQEPFSLFARLRGPVARKAARGDQEALAELESLNLPPEIKDLVLEYGRNKNEYVKYTSQARKMQTPRFDKYNTPGGTNPREIYLTLPFKEPAIPEGYKVTPVQYDDGTYRYFAETPTTRSQAFKTEQEAMSRLQEQITNLRGFRENQNALFTAPPGHSVSPEADKNRLAHIFLDDRTDAEGKKVLFVQEMQSDWGQQGRDMGFRIEGGVLTEAENARLTTLSLKDPMEMTEAEHNELMRLMSKTPLSESEQIANKSRLPAAPFVTSTEGWVNLALKRVINEAVENGYDKVAFISGQQAANKYRLSTVLDGIEVSPLPTTYISSTRQASPGSRVVELKQKGGGIIETYVDKDGTVEAVANESFRQFTGKPLSQIIGKEMSEKIMAAKPSEGGSVSFGVKDMEVGGEGMKGFYDNVLPKTANKLLAKLGSKIEPIDFPAKSTMSQEDYASYGALLDTGLPGQNPPQFQQLGFKITPEMVEMVKTKGLPLFAEGGPVTTSSFIKRALA